MGARWRHPGRQRSCLPTPAQPGISVSDGKSVGVPDGKRGQIRFPAENGFDPGSDLAFVFCSSFFNPGWTRTETVRGREGGLRRGVRGMDAAAKPPWTGSRRPLRDPPPPPPRRGKAPVGGPPPAGGGRGGIRTMDAAAKPPGTGSRRPLRDPPSRPERRKSAAFRDHPEGLRRWLDIQIPRKQKRPSTGPGRVRGSGQAGIRIPASLRRPVRWPSGDRRRCGGPAVRPVPGRPARWLAGPGLRRRAGRRRPRPHRPRRSTPLR